MNMTRTIICVAVVTGFIAHAQGKLFAADGSLSREAFTKPMQTIHVATGESGQVAEVKVKVGDRVRSGRMMLRLDTSVLEAARRIALADAKGTATIDAREVERDVATHRYEQLQKIASSGGATEEELRRAEADMKIAGCRLNEAQEQKRRFELQVEEVDAQIAARRMVSPIDGVVVDVHYEVGELIPSNEPRVVTVVDLSRLQAVFYLPTAIATRLKKDQSVVLEFSDGQTAKGTVDYVWAVTEYESGRVRVNVVIDNSKGRFRSGVKCFLKDDSSGQPQVGEVTAKSPQR